MTIGERVLKLIKEKGMTQKEFSEKTGIPQSTISDWKGKRLNPSADKIAIICDVLEMEPTYLLSGAAGKKYEKENYLYVSKNSNEYELLLDYRKLNEDMQNRLLGYLNALLQMHEEK